MNPVILVIVLPFAKVRFIWETGKYYFKDFVNSELLVTFAH